MKPNRDQDFAQFMATLERDAQRSRARKDANAFAQRVAQRTQVHGHRQHDGGAYRGAPVPRPRQRKQWVSTRHMAMTAIFAAVLSVAATIYQARDNSQAMVAIRSTILSQATATEESMSTLTKQSSKHNDMIMSLDRKNSEVIAAQEAARNAAVRLEADVAQLKAAQAKMLVSSPSSPSTSLGTAAMQTVPPNKDAYRARVRALQKTATAYAMGGNCPAMRESLAQLRAIDPGNNLFRARGNGIVRECTALEAFRRGMRLPTPQSYRP